MKVLLIVIDAASPRVFCPAVQTGRLKHLNRLAESGQMHQSSVSIFPSITPAATASIITGTYPAEHGIVGASWYDQAQDQVAYYGDDLWVVAREGFGAFLRDFLVHLNGDRLTAPTLFELVEQSGASAACLNFLIYRGLKAHRVNIPWLLAMLPGPPLTETVRGPSTLCLRDFVSDGRARQRVRGPHGPLHWFGMDDASTSSFLVDAAAAGTLADFTVAYFADNDYRNHEVGPYQALPVLDRVDAALGAVFDAAGGLDRLLSGTCVIVTSDHGHCDIGDDEILICPNMRAAQIYLRDRAGLENVTRAALADPRIDQIMWRTAPAGEGAGRYRVIGPRGDLTFWRADAGGQGARDAFGTAWQWQGDAAVLGLETDGVCVTSADYPNPFERIIGALDAGKSGDIWMTARPGCEFAAPGGQPHVGAGSHGALHALDSLSPVIAAGG